MRGTHNRQRLRIGIDGIIPALAGNTGTTELGRRARWDHPRACGEHYQNMLARDIAWGSSPRLRGTHRACGLCRAYPGIIPALAGNTRSHRGRASTWWDHPRACGEHRPRHEESRRVRGSSPRLRGTLAGTASNAAFGGIIPALAGNTLVTVAAVWVSWDHPRACGEHYTEKGIANRQAGSSPRLRGTQGTCAPPQPRLGIIPALAGNTGYGSTAIICTWDHPRACGEHNFSSISRML